MMEIAMFIATHAMWSVWAKKQWKSLGAVVMLFIVVSSIILNRIRHWSCIMIWMMDIWFILSCGH